MKNPLYYVDYWHDLIKFGFDRKHTFITLIVVCVSFIAPMLLLIAYQSAPSRKNIEDPFVFVGTISEFHKYDSYRGGTGCNISVRGSGNYVLAFRGTKGKVDIASTISVKISL